MTSNNQECLIVGDGGGQLMVTEVVADGSETVHDQADGCLMMLIRLLMTINNG